MSSRRTEDLIEEVVQIDPSQPLEITIENQNGDVTVRGGDRSDVLIRAEKHGNRGSAVYQEAELQMEFRIETDKARIAVRPVLPAQGRSGPSVSVDLDLGLDFLRDFLDPGPPADAREQRQHQRQERRERRRRGFAFTWDNSDVSYEIEVEVPREVVSRLQLNTASGDVEVKELTGAIELRTASGDASILRVIGDIGFEAASGDIRVRDSAGRLLARTASGDARIERSAFRSFGFHTASGDLMLDAALTGDGPFQIETVSGDSQLAVAAPDLVSGADRRIAVSFHTTSGDARLDRAFMPHGAGRWATAAGQPGPHIAVRTVSGDVRGKPDASAEARALASRVSDHPLPATAAPAPATSPVAPVLQVPPIPPVPPVPPVPVVPPVAAAVSAAPAEPAAETEQPEPIRVHTGGLTADAPTPAQAADRLALLEAVERGEIDIEEALQRLEDRDDRGTDPE